MDPAREGGSKRFVWAAGLFILLLIVGLVIQLSHTPTKEPEAKKKPQIKYRPRASATGAAAASTATAGGPATSAGIRIEVVTRDGKPIEGATVKGARETEYPRSLGKTDKSGALVLNRGGLTFGRDGVMPIRISHPLYSSTDIALVRESDSARVYLDVAPKITLRVSDESGNGIANAFVDELKAQRFGSYTVAARHAGDGLGVVSLTEIPSGALQLQVGAEGFEVREIHVMVAPAQEREIAVTLRRGVTLRVLVTDPAGAPVAGAKVKIQDPGSQTRVETETKDDGLVLVTTLSPESSSVEIEVLHPGFLKAYQTKELSPTKENLAMIQLKPGGRLTVHVLDEAGRRVRSQVTLRDNILFYAETQESSTEGPAEFKAVQPETSLNLEVTQDEGPVLVQPGVLIPAGQAQVLTLRIPNAIALLIHVSDETGEPIEGTLVMTSTDGKLGAVVPGPKAPGALTYCVRVPGSGIGKVTVIPGTYRTEFHASSGGSVVQELSLTQEGDVDVLFPAGRTLHGILLDEADRPLEGEHVYITTTNDSRFTATGPGGRFSFVRLWEGTGDLYVFDRYGGAVLIAERMTTLGRDVPVHFRRGRLRGRIINPVTGGTVQTELHLKNLEQNVGLISLAARDRRAPEVPAVAADGSFDFRLPPGRWQLDGGFGGTESSGLQVTVAAGEDLAGLTVPFTSKP